MFKYILGFIIVLAVVLVAITVGANNDQMITFNYIFAENQFRLSTLVAIFISNLRSKPWPSLAKLNVKQLKSMN